MWHQVLTQLLPVKEKERRNSKHCNASINFKKVTSLSIAIRWANTIRKPSAKTHRSLFVVKQDFVRLQCFTYKGQRQFKSFEVPVVSRNCFIPKGIAIHEPKVSSKCCSFKSTQIRQNKFSTRKISFDCRWVKVHYLIYSKNSQPPKTTMKIVPH